MKSTPKQIEQQQVRIDRVWAMPNKRTFEIEPISELLFEETEAWSNSWIDPFPFEYTKDATEYLNEIPNESVDIGLFDPPYSPRQLAECYKGKGEYDTKSSTWSNWKNLLARKIKPGGKAISFGWNSGGLGESRGFEIYRILLVPHGGMHNDTIVTCEKKIQGGLDTY